MKIRIKNGQEKEISCNKEQTILEALQEAGVYLPALCAGRGTCKKCKVRILEGRVMQTDREGKKEEIGQGREGLACMARAVSDLYLELAEADERQILVEGAKGNGEGEEKGEDLFLAVDIGTTTIAMALVGERSGAILDSYAALNRQRMYGADVISRIASANSGHLEELHRSIVEDLQQGINSLTRKGSRKAKKIIIAANTTMVHLLMGYSCESLGSHPFFSEHLERIDTSFGIIGADILTKEELEGKDIPVTILPGISAFVGGDITSDLLICPGFFQEGISFLLDMGTNGEMVIGNKDRLVAASTAAGPAFEGGNITCGTGSVPGAINQVKIMNRRAVIGTIAGKQPPVGLCGTGIIETIAELKRNRLMQSDGALRMPYDRTGFPLWSAGEKIAIYQQDIRQLQLAKGAIRAGMEQLMETFGCKPKEVDRIYLAGGFGTRLPIDAAIDIGLFPEEFKGKIESIGNGALYGAIAFGKKEENESKKQEELKKIMERIENLNLALAEGFEELYLKHLEI